MKEGLRVIISLMVIKYPKMIIIAICICYVYFNCVQFDQIERGSMTQQEKAITYIKQGLKNQLWAPGDRLPGLKRLAKDAGISHPIMGKALHLLADQGLLSILPSSGISVPLPKGSILQPSDIFEEKWKKIRNILSQDIFNQVIDPTHPFPSIKELGNRYGVSYQILKKALRSLEEDGLLKPHKRSYQLNLFSDPARTKIMVLVPMFQDKINKNAIDLKDKGFNLSNRGSNFLRKIEYLCNTQNLNADIWGYYSENDIITFVRPDSSECKSLENSNFYYGICLIKKAILSKLFIQMLCKLSIPISILEDIISSPAEGSEDTDWSVALKKNKRIRVFPIAKTDLAGKQIGRFLLQLGHRNIAFISSWQQELWSQTRYNGLSSVVSMVKDAQVHLFADNRFAAGVIHLEDKDLDKSIESFPSIKEIVKTYSLFSSEQAQIIGSMVNWTFINAIHRQRLEIFLQPLFEQAFLDKNITAWVCADDWMAIGALRFLRNKGVAIPQQISVVGFEDTADAYSNGLTTFNYDINAITQSMVAFISNPQIFPLKHGHIIEKSGFLVVRQSTGPAIKVF